MYQWLVGNLRLWSIEELVSSIFNLLDYESIYIEAVSKNCEVLQNLVIGVSL
nr:MAG TPA: hypothetical protein [Bacteriophage sp.]